MRAPRIVALSLLAALAGCAPLDARPPYVGVVTGEVVEGRLLVRFPPIEVVGKRSDAASPD